jgi:hypothetical protein
MPEGVRLDPLSGLLTWIPAASQTGITYSITVLVADNGLQPLSDSLQFSVKVEGPVPPPAIQRGSMSFSNGRFSFAWASLVGMRYQVQFKNLIDAPTWTNIGEPRTAEDVSMLFSDDVTGIKTRFYRVLVVEK